MRVWFDLYLYYPQCMLGCASSWFSCEKHEACKENTKKMNCKSTGRFLKRRRKEREKKDGPLSSPGLIGIKCIKFPPHSFSPRGLSYEVPWSLAACRQLPWQTVASKSVYEVRAAGPAGGRWGSLATMMTAAQYSLHPWIQYIKKYSVRGSIKKKT